MGERVSVRDRDTYSQALTSPVKLNLVWIKHTLEGSRADVYMATHIYAVGADVVLGVELEV